MKLKINSETVRNAYDNQGAHEAVKSMMAGGEKLSVKFGTGKNDKIPYAWVESKTIRGFKYQLNEKSLQWLWDYLTQGKVEDFGINPLGLETTEEDFQEAILRDMITEKQRIQFTPLFRETTGYISGMASYEKGLITFKVKRTPELVEFLRDHNQSV